jgi:VanZ family protein
MIYPTLLLVWMALIFYASHQPGLHTVPWLLRFGLVPPGLDPALLDLVETVTRKAVHLFTYGVLAVLAHRSLRQWRPRTAWREPARTAFLLALLYGIADELHQRLVPGRSGEVRDVLIDAAGALLGLLLLRWYDRTRGRLSA